MITIGITGIIGSGKTTVSAALKNKGFVVIDLDVLAKKVLAQPDVQKEIEKDLGKEFTGSEEDLRKKLRDTVFIEKEKLAKLENIIHPNVRKMLFEELEGLNKQGIKSAIVDGPLIYEKGLDKELDKVIVVSAAMELIRERLIERGMSTGDIEKRTAKQMPLKEKEKKADFILFNNGTKEDLEGDVEMLSERIKEWEVSGNAP